MFLEITGSLLHRSKLLERLDSVCAVENIGPCHCRPELCGVCLHFVVEIVEKYRSLSYEQSS